MTPDVVIELLRSLTINLPLVQSKRFLDIGKGWVPCQRCFYCSVYGRGGNAGVVREGRVDAAAGGGLLLVVDEHEPECPYRAAKDFLQRYAEGKV